MFEVHTLLLILGGALVLLGVIGGGLVIREVSIPKIPNSTRVFAVLIGIALLSGGSYLGHLENQRGTPGGPMSPDLQAQIKRINDQLAKTQQTTIDTALSQAETKPQGNQTESARRQLADSEQHAKEEAIRQIEARISNELEETKRKLEQEHAAREAESRNIEEEKKRLEADYRVQAERMKADLEAQWAERVKQNQKALANQNAETARIAQEQQARAAQEQNARNAQKQKEQDTRQIESVVAAYWKAVGNRDVETACGLWVDLSQDKRNALQKIIQAKESLELLSVTGTVYPPDNAAVDFTLRYKDQGIAPRAGSGTFSLRWVDGSWKIESIAKWSNQ